MRTLLFSALAAGSFGLATTTPASAARDYYRAPCFGPDFVCGPAKPSAESKPSSAFYDAKPRKRKAASRRSPSEPKRVARSYTPAPSYSDGGSAVSHQSGMASYYWQGQMTASGAGFNPNGLTAAHRSLPFGTRVRVTNHSNGRSVVVKINDRGPFIRGRIIDLSSGAAGVIGMKSAGVARVSVAVLR